LASPDVDPYDPAISERYFYSVWHDSILVPTFAKPHHHTAALTSQHADGSFVAHVLRCVGISTVRGSTNRITTGSIRSIMDQVKEYHFVITPDGPRGPRREISQGILYLASKTGHGIIPTAFVSSSCWRIPGSWTDLMIPKPFSKTILVAGAPIFLPDSLSAADLALAKETLQEAMNHVDELANSLAGKPSPGECEMRSKIEPI